jgi:hypothetical protein
MPTPPSQAEQWLSDAQAAVTRQEPAFALEKYLQFLSMHWKKIRRSALSGFRFV